MYRKTAKAVKHNQKMANMRAAKERKRLEGEPPEYPMELPYLRKRIIIEDYDTGELVTHTLELFKSDRCDCYKVHVDGELWKQRAGLSRVLEGIRKALPRVLSPSSL